MISPETRRDNISYIRGAHDARKAGGRGTPSLSLRGWQGSGSLSRSVSDFGQRGQPRAFASSGLAKSSQLRLRGAPAPVAGGYGRRIHAGLGAQLQQILRGNDGHLRHAGLDGANQRPDGAASTGPT
jgi:hypothetical protein